MQKKDEQSFTSEFWKGWRETWLSFGKWLGGCAPVLVILGTLFAIFVGIAIFSAAFPSR